MPGVRIRDHEAFDSALRRFKRICEKAGVLTEARRHEFYEKPTWKRKRKAAAAKKRLAKRVFRETTFGASAASSRTKEKDKDKEKRRY